MSSADRPKRGRTLITTSTLPANEVAPDEAAEIDRDDPDAWVAVAMDAAEDKLGERTVAYRVGEVMGIVEWFVISTGRNERQVRAIADDVEFQIGRRGGPKPIRVEGLEDASWVLMDYGDIVVHVFSETAREYYDIDRLFKDMPQYDRA